MVRFKKFNKDHSENFSVSQNPGIDYREMEAETEKDMVNLHGIHKGLLFLHLSLIVERNNLLER